MDWIKTSEQLPTVEILQKEQGIGSSSTVSINCFIFIDGTVEESPFSLLFESWFDPDCDMFEYSALEPSHWMLSYPWPEPPKE